MAFNHSLQRQISGRSLPWRIFGRLIRPYALAVSLSTALVVYAPLTETLALGTLLNGIPGDVVVVAGTFAVALLWAGWWARNDDWMRHGLFWTTGVWASVAGILWIETGFFNINTLLSWCWVVASGGAWLLEETDARAVKHE